MMPHGLQYVLGVKAKCTAMVLDSMQIRKKELKRVSDCWKCNFFPWHFVLGEKLYFEAFYAGFIIEVKQCGAIEHMNLMDMRHVQQRKQAM